MRCAATAGRCEKPEGHDDDHYTTYRDGVWAAAPRAEGLDHCHRCGACVCEQHTAYSDDTWDEQRRICEKCLSRPSDERVPCLCGADENPNGPRLDIVCPKHDGELGVPESEER